MIDVAPKTFPPDINAIVFGYLREMAGLQTVRPKAQAYGRAAATVFALERQLTELRDAGGALPKLPAVGPSSLRVVQEVIDTGASETVTRAAAANPRKTGIAEQGSPDPHILSRARVLEILTHEPADGLLASYLGDLQMHSSWSDGQTSIADMATACAARGYRHMAITDHAGGLSIANGLSMDTVTRQHAEIDRLNAGRADVRILKGIEANITADGRLDLSVEDLQRFEIVLAAPHAHLRVTSDQTERLLRAVGTPGVHILAHPRGRKIGSRAGIVADWDAVFKAAARQNVAIEIDGYAERQDLDHVMARRALAAGCVFALDSDAHSPDQLLFAETAMAHARLAGIPASRVINCWPLLDLLRWAKRSDRRTRLTR